MPEQFSRSKRVLDTVQTWQSRPLEAVYPILCLDGLAIKVHQDHRVIHKTMHTALGLNLAGQKEVLGRWLADLEILAEHWNSKYLSLSQ